MGEDWHKDLRVGRKDCASPPRTHALPIRTLASEREAYPQAHRAPIIDTVLIEARPDAPEVFIALKLSDREELTCHLVNLKSERAQFGEI